MKKYIIALDQGTTSSRAIIFDDRQNLVGLAQRELPQIYAQEGWVEHDPMEIYATQYGVMVEALTRNNLSIDEIAAIGITNQRETTILWEKATGKPLYNAIVWQCRRTAEICEQLKKDGHEPYIKEATGLLIDAYFSATKVKWILDHVKGARERARKGEILFGTVDTCQWFERHGVALTAQADGCVFPLSQDAHTISGLFMSEARRLGIAIKTGCRVTTLDELNHFDNICIAIGGQPRSENLRWLEHDVVEPVPSLFTLSVADQGLRTLMGTVIDHTMVMIPGTKMRAQGALLLTHWGLSGPAILRLSSYGARLLAEHHYQMPLMVNWAGVSEAEAANAVATMVSRNSRRQLMGMTPLELPQRLWAHLAVKALGQRAVQAPWGSVNAKEQRRLATVLTADECEVSGRAPHRDEFVTCGGVALSAVHQLTLESRTRPRLYFAGEVLDVDGITGGFNLQAAWTMAHTVARAIAAR